MRQLYQTVTLYLADGRRLTYTGPAQIVEGDEPGEVKVAAVDFSHPRPLPLGFSFDSLLGNEIRVERSVRR